MECTHPFHRRRRARERESATIEGMAETTSNASSTESSSNASTDEEDSDDDLVRRPKPRIEAQSAAEPAFDRDADRTREEHR